MKFRMNGERGRAGRIPGPIWHFFVLALAAFAFISRAEEDHIFRMAISSRLMADINENDAKAAVRTWGQTLAEQSGVPVDPNVRILTGADTFIRAFREKDVDSATMTTEEFLAVDREIALTNLLAEGGKNSGDIYLLLTHEQSKIKSLEDLKGRELLASDSMRMSLSLIWLDVLLARQGLPAADQFFSGINRKKKLSVALLPVFFRSAEVCLVSQRGLEAMAELNPQVGKQLRVLAASERLVAGLVCFRSDYVSPNKEKLVRGVLHFHETPRGQQVLTLFQSNPVEPLPREALDSAIQLLAEHNRLCSPGAVNVTADTTIQRNPP